MTDQRPESQPITPVEEPKVTVHKVSISYFLNMLDQTVSKPDINVIAEVLKKAIDLFVEFRAANVGLHPSVWS